MQQDTGRAALPPQDSGVAGLPAHIRAVCEAWLHGLQAVLGPRLHAAYLYGAVTFPEGGATGDIDFHVILRDRLDSRQAEPCRRRITNL